MIIGIPMVFSLSALAQRPDWAPNPQDSIIQPGIAALSCAAPAEEYLGNGQYRDLPASDSYSFAIVDLRDPELGKYTPVGNAAEVLNRPPYHHPSWSVDKIGNVFGITYDRAGNVYLAAHGIYGEIEILGGPGGNQGAGSYMQYGSLEPGVSGFARAATIYKIDAVTGVASVFNLGNANKVPQQPENNSKEPAKSHGPGLGDIAYDEKHNQFFVTSLEDGKIYRYDASGNLVGQPFDPLEADSGAAGMPEYSERIWAVAVKDGRLYYSVWNEGGVFPSNPGRAAEIRSVNIAIDGSLDALSDRIFYNKVPVLNLENSDWAFEPGDSLPVADISFSRDGQTMLLAERLMRFGNDAFNHDGRVHIIGRALGNPAFRKTLYPGIGPDDSFFEAGGGYGGVAFGDESGEQEALIWCSAADMIEEQGPQGLQGVRVSDLPRNSSPREASEFYRVNYDPAFDSQAGDQKGGGGDLEIYQRPDGINQIAQNAYIKPSDIQIKDYFGRTSAIDGDVMVIGSVSGVTILRRNAEDGLIQEETFLPIINGSTQLRKAVAVSGDTVVIGLEDHISIYGYSSFTGSWVEQDIIETPRATRGSNSLSIDGNRIAAGLKSLYGSDEEVYIYQRSNGDWIQEAILKAENANAYDNFGFSVAISGDSVVVGASAERSRAIGVNGDASDNSGLSEGAAYVFEKGDTGGWSQTAYLKPFPVYTKPERTQFGYSVDISGDTIVVGMQTSLSPFNHANAWTFVKGVNGWQTDQRFPLIGAHGHKNWSKSVAICNDILAVGNPQASSQEGQIGVNAGRLGGVTSVSSVGAVQLFERNSDGWNHRADVRPNHVERHFDFSNVRMSGRNFLVSAPSDNINASGVNPVVDLNAPRVSAVGGSYFFDLCIENENAVWSKEEEDTPYLNFSGHWALGYHFTPQVNGKVTHLGGLFEGPKMVKLFDYDSGQLLASTLVESRNRYEYRSINPIDVESGKRYTVAAYFHGAGFSAAPIAAGGFPRLVEHIRIDSSCYADISSDRDARPSNTALGFMYGQPDIKFVADE